MTGHPIPCSCRACALRSELAGIKMAWQMATYWRLDWRKLAKEYNELVEYIGPDAEGGQA